MGERIKTWQIVDGELRPIETSLAEQGRREAEHLEAWIASESSIIGDDIVIIGRQVSTVAGPLDLLGVDVEGNTVIVELKRDRLAREVVAQAIDYASAVSSWSIEKLSEECAKYRKGASLEEVLAEAFGDMDVESLSFNDSQRILLVGFGADASLVRMVEWLSDHHGVNINALLLHYTRSSSGDELLSRTTVISEEEQRTRVGRQKKFTIAMSDEPGSHDPEELRQLLVAYLSSALKSARRIREILLPACLERGRMTREELVQELIRQGDADTATQAGRSLSSISGQLGVLKNDFLRQVIDYEYPEFSWQKDNYRIREGYRDLVAAVLMGLQGSEDGA